jgi:hypothetical protein
VAFPPWRHLIAIFPSLIEGAAIGAVNNDPDDSFGTSSVEAGARVGTWISAVSDPGLAG